MSLFLCFVRAPFKLALLNWMPLDKYWINKPRLKFQQSHSPEQTRLFRTTPPLWNLTTAGYPKCIPVESSVPVQQADVHLDESPLKNIAGSMVAGLLHPRAFFQVFPLISVSQSSCPVPMRDWPFFVTYPGRRSRRLPASLWKKWTLNELTALHSKALTLTFPFPFPFLATLTDLVTILAALNN